VDPLKLAHLTLTNNDVLVRHKPSPNTQLAARLFQKAGDRDCAVFGGCSCYKVDNIISWDDEEELRLLGKK